MPQIAMKIILIIVYLTGIYLCLRAVSRKKKLADLLNFPPVHGGPVYAGRISYTGKVIPRGNIRTPVSGKICAFFTCIVKNNKGIEIYRSSSRESFFIDRNSSLMHVYPDKAMIFLEDQLKSKSCLGSALSPDIRTRINATPDSVVTEYFLCDGDTVTVCGNASSVNLEFTQELLDLAKKMDPKRLLDIFKNSGQSGFYDPEIKNQKIFQRIKTVSRPDIVSSPTFRQDLIDILTNDLRTKAQISITPSPGAVQSLNASCMIISDTEENSYFKSLSFSSKLNSSMSFVLCAFSSIFLELNFPLMISLLLFPPVILFIISLRISARLRAFEKNRTKQKAFATA